MRMRNGRALVLLAGLALLAVPGAAETDQLMDLSLEELSELRITSVSKREAPLGSAAAAVYVITREDMRRSGYTSVAQALRLVPGLQVARENSHDWAIGARGFNTGLSNKLLVLIDGRSVYSPLFSGVFWELQDVPVEDIDRIEVIRGPGATLWGANAVNGVINIITRPAAEASGWTLRGGGGTEERAFGVVRYGGEAGESGDFRLTASGFARDDMRNRGGVDDEWWLTRVQGRGDWEPTGRDTLTLTTEVYGAQLDQDRPRATVAAPTAPPDPEDGERIGANALARWTHVLDGGSDVTSQLWYEYTDYEFTIVEEVRHTADLDLQHHVRLGDVHDVVWGGSYRFSHDELEERGTTTLDPRVRGIHLLGGFVQDEIALWPDRLALTLGSKFEWNEFTGFEVQPSGRLALTPNDNLTFWGAVSRAVRTPTRFEDDSDLGIAVLPAGSGPFQDPARPTLFVFRGNNDFDSEKVLTGEIGFRARPHESLSFDVAAFYSDYDALLSTEFGASTVVPASGGVPEHRLFPLVIDNELEGITRGVEVAGWWQVQPWWRVHASYSYLDMALRTSPGSTDTLSEPQEDSSPKHQAFFRTSFDLPHDVRFDAIARYVDHLPAFRIPSYWEFDARLAWGFCDAWEVAVVGQNLAAKHHAEAQGGNRVQRGVYGQLSWRWGGSE